MKLAGLELPPGIIWEDEGAYSPVRQETRRSLGGRLLVYPGTWSKGMPVTLTSLQDQGWMLYGDVLTVKAMADVAGGEYALEMRGGTERVMFRHHEGPALEYRPLISRGVPLADDWYLVTIKLMTV